MDKGIKGYQSYLEEGKIREIYDKTYQDLIDCTIDLEHPTKPFEFSYITKVGIKGMTAFVILISIHNELNKESE